ncbi:hypothetical protein BD324DRAFT_81364 [Kockovaella imperatae]|uniref:Uncharacterized protein n=1 Tax=Kockovaella imperatae TaxID=4999 RepID=A0A1Y1UE81_9TREE|nr:hypothetical protein BD324DRAFT_81364 [Kockovaella imperatae]ORX35814.1 hypothetical protein BD324DRAFT_81364 [Kockovaella imperatae]
MDPTEANLFLQDRLEHAAETLKSAWGYGDKEGRHALRRMVGWMAGIWEDMQELWDDEGMWQETCDIALQAVADILQLNIPHDGHLHLLKNIRLLLCPGHAWSDVSLYEPPVNL